MTEVAVTDAHAIIWYGRRRWKRLGRRARKIFEAAEQGDAAIYVPTVALVEVLEAAHAGVIDLEHGASEWAEGLFSSGGFFPVDLSVEIVLRAEELYAIRERGDRLIAATAAELDFPLISRDPEITEHAMIDLIW